jgi:hypothetical protein
MNKTRLANEFIKFLKLAEGINSYSLREHSLRKLKYDFDKYEKNDTEGKLNEEFFSKLENDYIKLERIRLMQNMYVPYENFPFKKTEEKI